MHKWYTIVQLFLALSHDKSNDYITLFIPYYII